MEAKSTANGIGLVKLMGRHSGFIACYAALARSGADAVLIPEVPFALDGERGLLAHLRSRVAGARARPWSWSAEGAGQDLLGGTPTARGTPRATPGCRTSARSCGGGSATTSPTAGIETSIRYIDPSYAIRSVPANPYDSVYCVRLSQAAVHAAMSGRTEMVVGRYRRRFVHIPMVAAVSRRNQVDPQRRPLVGRAGVHRSAGRLRVSRPGYGAVRLALRFLGHSTVRVELAGTVC